MRKRPELYVIREPKAAVASNVISIGALRPRRPARALRLAPPASREHAWRDLVRRLQKSPIGTET